MPNTTDRERARLKKQRQRDRRRQRHVALAEAEAVRLEAEGRHIEARDEALAPAVMRRPVTSAGGARTILGARVRIVDGRPVRAMTLLVGADPIVSLARQSGSITAYQLAAAQRLQADWEEVGRGITVAASDFARPRGGSGGDAGPSRAIIAQIETRRRLEGAVAHLGAFAPAVARVLFDRLPLSVWADEVGKSADEAVAWMAAALTRLAAFYRPGPTGQREPSRGPGLTIAPPREADTMP